MYSAVTQKKDDGTEKKYIVDLLMSYGLNSCTIEITSKCNLRCIYCPKSSDDYNSLPGRNQDSLPETIDQFVDFISKTRPKMVDFTAVGEVSFYENWEDVVGRISDLGFRMSLTSNFSRIFTDSELDALLKFSFIRVSIDTIDVQEQKRLRKAVDVRNILTNILSLRARSHLTGKPMPFLEVNTVALVSTVSDLPRLAAVCNSAGVNRLALCQLNEIPENAEHGLDSFSSTDDKQRADAVEKINKTIALLQGANMTFFIYPKLLQILTGNKKGGNDVAQTKVCTEPWDSFTVAADGKVFICGRMRENFYSMEDGADAILNGSKIRDMRQRLLNGDLPDFCQDCNYYDYGSTQDLMQLLASKAILSGQAQEG
jgi:radical SAM protein with 4Fe4S-binding SPASM domain